MALVEQMAAGEVNQDPSCKRTYISHLGKRMIIDSKWSFLQIYMSFQEEIILLRITAEVGVRTKNSWGCSFFVPVLRTTFVSLLDQKRHLKGRCVFILCFFRTASRCYLPLSYTVKFGLDIARNAANRKIFGDCLRPLGLVLESLDLDVGNLLFGYRLEK